MDSLNNYLAHIKAFKIQGNLYVNQQNYYIPINMDSYAKLDFISINFIYLLNLTPYQKC